MISTHYRAPATEFALPTFAHPDLIQGKAPRRHLLEWWAANCLKLAAFMAALPRHLHDQGHWAEPENNECGTTACALGWACLSHIIDGLQYREVVTDRNTQHAELRSYKPMANGQPVIGNGDAWRAAGKAFFGDTVQVYVFDRVSLTTPEVVDALRRCAKEYRAEARDYPRPLPLRALD